ncbi:MAG: hypothetical protein J5694_02690 [Erysipelotrichaceae bacterium]|nr:hypothetical protein [Erysipelotrichaceae bacterium]
MNTRSPITGKASRGFISVYFIFLLLVATVMVGYLTESISRYLYFLKNLEMFRTMNNVEVLVIGRLRYAYRNYQEKDELLYYDGCAILITIDGDEAEITIMSHGYSRERRLRYDSEKDLVESYR